MITNYLPNASQPPQSDTYEIDIQQITSALYRHRSNRGILYSSSIAMHFMHLHENQSGKGSSRLYLKIRACLSVEV